MKVAIIGTQGIPANYGGFETLVEFIIDYLPQNYEITVYCSSKDYSYKRKEYKSCKLVYIPFKANGIQSIPYDIFSLFSAAKKNDVILILGISGCIILPFFKIFHSNKSLIINIDGLEHKREKWNILIKKFLKVSERVAVKYGNKIITDNREIQAYVMSEYSKKSHCIAYGGDHVKNMRLTEAVKFKYNLIDKYAFKVCRIEPENNVEMILKSFSKLDYQLVIVGNWNHSSYGRNLKHKYSKIESIKLLDAIYDQTILNQIRSNCSIYIHGHSAGGTNPSLVEAMNLSLPVFAYDVSYNKSTTFNKAKYFKNSDELIQLVKTVDDVVLGQLGTEMKDIAMRNYTWGIIAKEYEKLFAL